MGKPARKKPTKGGSKIGGAIAAAAGIATTVAGRAGRSKGTGSRRKRGVSYWQNKVLVAKLKKRFQRIVYGGR